MSVWNQAKEGRWPHWHPQLVRWGGGGGGGGGVVRAQRSDFVVSLIPDPLMSLWFPCQSVLMELTVVMLVHILISCSRTVAQPSSVCSAPADQQTACCAEYWLRPPCQRGEYALGDSCLRILKLSRPARAFKYKSALNYRTSMNRSRGLLEVNAVRLMCWRVKRSGSRSIEMTTPRTVWHFSQSSSPTANQFMLKWLTVINP